MIATGRARPRIFATWWLVGLGLVAAAAYANALHAPFMMDDGPHIVKSEAIRPPVTISKLMSTVRPTVTSSLALNFAASPYAALEILFWMLDTVPGKKGFPSLYKK